MEQAQVSMKRRMQIFMTGIFPLFALGAILGMAANYGLDLVSVFKKVEHTDAANYFMVTKIFGIPISSRPVTPEELKIDDALGNGGKILIICFALVVTIIALSMCWASITGTPKGLLSWYDKKLGSVQWSHQRKRRA